MVSVRVALRTASNICLPMLSCKALRSSFKPWCKSVCFANSVSTSSFRSLNSVLRRYFSSFLWIYSIENLLAFSSNTLSKDLMICLAVSFSFSNCLIFSPNYSITGNILTCTSDSYLSVVYSRKYYHILLVSYLSAFFSFSSSISILFPLILSSIV